MKFRIHTQESAPAASRAALEATATKYGFLPNIFGVLAESPAAAQAYVGITKALEQSVLTPVEQQVVALTVSTANSCTYCVGAHSMVAQMVQMP
ncbi:MAG: carboxymuconolactone decarboxylase family protein [Nitrospira sp.]|nr:carboxymuconolactone decarboxylase family protein [Nitrospira sp.]